MIKEGRNLETGEKEGGGAHPSTSLLAPFACKGL